ncbi:hypothetical protein DKX38_002354 [Salix brachista]|uniref:Uncharacterized protein n=1 Tax=Salix brachista TaxID=2182728 RepID=A0A5N5NPS7_9ROSI|nr:hypothetical protein DKX38_002354 [Salix brachista]
MRSNIAVEENRGFGFTGQLSVESGGMAFMVFNIHFNCCHSFTSYIFHCRCSCLSITGTGGDPDFVLDFDEIYVIDSKTKSITRAKVLVTVPGGRNRDRKTDLLVVRDKGNSFKIIHSSEREDPTTIIEKEEWARSRQDMERHLRKLRDFDVSNWF